MPEADVLDAAVARMLRAMVALACGGALLLLVWRGWTWAAGFAIGAVISYLNFRWLKQIVGALGEERPKARMAVLMGLRYLLLGGGGYVIVKYTSISLPAALAGLFVSVGAVIFEILFQLVYARV